MSSRKAHRPRTGPHVVKHMRPVLLNRPEQWGGVGEWGCSSCRITDAASQPDTRAKAPNGISSDLTGVKKAAVARCAQCLRRVYRGFCCFSATTQMAWWKNFRNPSEPRCPKYGQHLTLSQGIGGCEAPIARGGYRANGLWASAIYLLVAPCCGSRRAAVAVSSSALRSVYFREPASLAPSLPRSTRAGRRVACIWDGLCARPSFRSAPRALPGGLCHLKILRI